MRAGAHVKGRGGRVTCLCAHLKVVAALRVVLLDSFRLPLLVKVHCAASSFGAVGTAAAFPLVLLLTDDHQLLRCCCPLTNSQHSLG